MSPEAGSAGSLAVGALSQTQDCDENGRALSL